MSVTPTPFPVETVYEHTKLLTVEFVVGSSGSIGAVTRGDGFGTPVATGSGVYTFALSQTWGELVGYQCEAVGALVTTTGVKTKLTTNSVASTSAPLVAFTFMRPDTGAAANPSDGNIVKCWLLVRQLNR
jgi:hypothetical protein